MTDEKMRDERRFDLLRMDEDLSAVTEMPNLWTIGLAHAMARAVIEAEWHHDGIVMFHAGGEIVGGSMGPDFPHERWDEAIMHAQAHLDRRQ